MAFIHQIYTMPSTFGQLADRLLQDLMHMAIQCRCLRVDFVCDQYPVQSIKNCERERRAMGGTRVIHITRPDHKPPKQFKKYLVNGRNKELLIEFIFQCWSMCDPGILGNVLLVVSHGDVCHSIVVNDAVVAVTEVPDLFSYHEEADTWLLLHVHQAARAFSSVTIKSPDTDVMVLSLAKSQDVHGCLLLFMIVSDSNNRIINITELGIKLGQEKCQFILGLHTFTECNNISAFKGKGKTNPFGLMLESEAFCSAFKALRCGWEVPDDILPDVEKFVCTPYGQKVSAGVNAESYNLFRLTCRSESLPPNQDCLKHQIAGQITRLQFIVAPSNGSLTRLLQ